MNLINIIKDRKNWIAVGFSSYILSTLVFALIYNRIVARDSRNFLFNSNIQSERVSYIKSSTTSKLEKLHVQLDAYKQLELAVTQKIDISGLSYSKQPFIITKNGYKFVFLTIESESKQIAGPPRKHYHLMVIVYDKSGNQVDVNTLPFFYWDLKPTQRKLQNYASNSTNFIKNSIGENQRRLVDIDNYNPQIWSFWDFLYFSVLTQTTVGYGDVLPNTALAKVIVSLQVLTGLTIPITVIQLLFLTIEKSDSR